MTTRALSLIVVGAALALVTACSASVQGGGATISKTSLEQGIADALQKSVGQRPDAVECPGAIKAKAGETARCVLTAGSVRYGLTATVTSYENGKAHYQAQVDRQPMR
ncbi:DUF4333 domain-containing protein [Amycolatopsis cynarae]|uniref:DUF4333 domain-containing protein n=1 Tax=Amycolatopsis cynarae TaxID=2995223 RepID=A0ABY7AW83_9PSEU|nr:DUF4333 domain-containing protein [Amycolatopsis sp. HUAS 11-8]WAL64241.1 DUF4333 domain-containing protein [Amycolatopsis sp. HUAS 11-8]